MKYIFKHLFKDPCMKILFSHLFLHSAQPSYLCENGFDRRGGWVWLGWPKACPTKKRATTRWTIFTSAPIGRKNPSHFCRLQRSEARPRLASCRCCTPLSWDFELSEPSQADDLRPLYKLTSRLHLPASFLFSSLWWVGTTLKKTFTVTQLDPSLIQCTMYIRFHTRPMGQTCSPAKNNLSPWKQGDWAGASTPFPLFLFLELELTFREFALLGTPSQISSGPNIWSVCPQSWLHYINASDNQCFKLNFELRSDVREHLPKCIISYENHNNFSTETKQEKYRFGTTLICVVKENVICFVKRTCHLLAPPSGALVVTDY